MSLEAMATVLHHSKAKGTAKLVLLGIANHQGDGGAWPSIATLATYANVHERNVQRAVHELQQLGELAVHVQRGGTLDSHRFDFLRPNRYDVLLSCPAWCDRTYQHRTLPAWRDQGDGTHTLEPQPETLPGLEGDQGDDDQAADVDHRAAQDSVALALEGAHVDPPTPQPVDVELPDALPGPCISCGRPAHPPGTPTCCGLCAHQAVELVEPHAHRYSGGRCVVSGCSARVRQARPAPAELLRQVREGLATGALGPVDKPGGDSATG